MSAFLFLSLIISVVVSLLMNYCKTPTMQGRESSLCCLTRELSPLLAVLAGEKVATAAAALAVVVAAVVVVVAVVVVYLKVVRVGVVGYLQKHSFRANLSLHRA